VLLIHGFGGSAECSETLLAGLAARGVRVYAFDFPGFGRSPALESGESPLEAPAAARPGAVPTGGKSLAEHARIAIEVARALGLDAGSGPRRFDVVGMSMGGPIAAEVFRRHSQRIARLVLLAPAGLSVPVPIHGRISKIPYLGEVVTGLLGKAALAHRYS
jgi:pimeloyl-ACP methyl ester carboxylesterase